jgi:hypothetical protein
MPRGLMHSLETPCDQGLAHASGIALDMSPSPSTFHFDNPPMRGELRP